jgi:hypothetical protein
VAILAGLSVLLMLLVLLPHREVRAETTPAQPLLPDYGISELSALESLDELLPANLYGIEVVIFKRLNTSQSLLATADDVSQIRVESHSTTTRSNSTVDSTSGGIGSSATIGAIQPADAREPLLLTSPRLLPSNLYALSAPKREKEGPPLPTLDDEPQCWPMVSLANPNAPLASAADNLPRDSDRSWETSMVQDAETALELSPPLGSDLEMAPERETLVVQSSAVQTSILQALDPESTPYLNATNSDAIVNTPEPMFVATRPVPLSKSSVIVTPYLSLIQQLTAFAQGVEDNQYRMRPEARLTLSAQARRLEASGDFQILEHIGWHQRVPARNAPQRIYIHKDNELQGYLSVTLGRYLHTAATLWLDPVGFTISPSFTSDGTGPSDLQRPYAELKQSRRMRSGELHYFDHPLFGLLVRIDKVTHPENLTSEFEGFKSAQTLASKP